MRVIAKHVPMRALARSDFAGLVDYITDDQDTSARLGPVTVTNCAAASLAAVTGEVLATQQQNTRAAGDKTYHLLVSFRAGEVPAAETLQAIEARLCAGLGYGEHQRVSAVHHDTDNLHLHIAINKIHPGRHTMHEPFQSYRTLATLCATLEREYGLEPDNHTSQRTVAEGRAADMEHHAGLESLVGWVRRVCLEDMWAAPSWAALHQVLRENGLALRVRDNGLVIEAADGTRVKASTVARALSRPSLEARLGPFEAASEGTLDGAPSVAGRRHYDKPPLALRVDTAALYVRYQAEQRRAAVTRAEGLAHMRRRKARAIEDARRANRLWRATIRVVDGQGVGKRALYAQASHALREQLGAIRAAFAREREALSAATRRRAWADWLKHAALEGDTEALAALRAREAARGLQGNTVSARGAVSTAAAVPRVQRDTLTKKGTILFQAGASAVRDDGDRLQVSGAVTREGVRAALELALARYGDRISVCGTPAFKAQVIRVAVEAALPLTFTDPALEERRQHRLHKETAHEHATPDGRGSPDRRGAGRAGVGAADAGSRARRARGIAVPASVLPSAALPVSALPLQPHPGRAGGVPPPERQHRLRGLSELGVVRFADGAEVLLPGDVPRHLEQPGTQPDHALRRGVPGAGGRRARRLNAGVPEPAALAAAQAYIAEREEKRLRGIDIPKHALYTQCADVILFGGLRQCQGETLVLLRHGAAQRQGETRMERETRREMETETETVMVLPVDATTARRLSRVALGAPLRVTARGSIQRSRGPRR